MDSEIRPSVLIRIILPLFFLLLVNVAPLPHRLVYSLHEARRAQAGGQPGIAAARLGEAVRLAPWRLDLLEPLAMQELAAGHEPRAVEALRAALRAGALSVGGHEKLGELLLARGDTGAALEVFYGLANRPDAAAGAQAALWEKIYRLERARRGWQAAEAALRSWRGIEPALARPAYLQGLLLAASDPAKALAPLLEAEALDPRYSRPVQELRAALDQAAEAGDPGYAWLVTGRALGRLDEWDLALAAFDQATQAAPEYAEAWAFLAEARYQNGLAPHLALERARQIDPESSLVKALAALFLRRSGQPAQAESYLLELARQEPGEPVWLLELGNTTAEKGDLIAARAYFDRALAVSPQSAVALKAAAVFSVQYNVEPRELGLEAARRLVNLDPDDAEALDLMGQVFMRLEDAASAERFLQRAVEKEANFAAAYLHLGQLYLQTNDSSRALIYLRRAAALSESGPVGSTARRLLQRYFNEGG